MPWPSNVSRIARWLRAPRGVYVALTVVHSAWLATHFGGDRWRVMIGDGFFTPTFLVIAIFAWRAANAYSAASRRTGAEAPAQFAHAWRQLAVAYGMLWISNLFWFWSDVSRVSTAEPVYAEVLDLCAYVVLIIGLLRFPVIRGDGKMRRRLSLDLLTVGVGAALAIWYVLIHPLESVAGARDLGAFTTALGDVGVIVAVSMVMFRHGTSRDQRWLRWLAAGHLASCIASVIAGALQLRHAYAPGAPIDALWMVGDLLIFLAADDAAVQADAVARAPRAAQPVRGQWASDDASAHAPVVGVQLWLPYCFAAIAFGVLLDATAPLWHGPLGIVVAANAMVLLLVAVRQGIALRDNVTLARAHLAQERRFRSLVQFSSDLTTVIDRAGTIVYQSPAVQRMLGFTTDATIGTPVRMLVHPDEHARLDRLMAQGARLLEAPARGDDDAARETRRGSGRPSTWRLRHRSGRYLWAESVATTMRAESGEFLVINTRDVSERVILEAQLRSAQKLEAVGRLAGGIAHDFNNLLMTVRGNVSMLRPRTNDPVGPEQVELDEIDAAVDRAASLTRQLLTFSRRQVIQTQRLDLGRVVDGLAPLVRRLLGPSVALRLDLADDAWLEADPGQIEQVVMNLAANSGEAMPSGGELRIAVALVDVSVDEARLEPGLLPGRHVALVVADTGCGMSAETLTHAFEPFFTTKSSGSGLGLSTVFGIATQLGGHVAVQSTVGVGTRFVVRLPRAPAASAAPAMDPGTAPPAEAMPGAGGEARGRAVPAGRGERILIVDDEVTVRRALQRILVRDGYEVLTASDGIEALELEARTEGAIHLLLTDIMMPRMDGRELMRRFAARRPDAAIVCMSGFVDDALRESLPLADHAFLMKPFSIGGVRETVHRELELRLPV